MFWPGIVEDILPKLHAFSKQQYDYGFGLWSSPTGLRSGTIAVRAEESNL